MVYDLVVSPADRMLLAFTHSNGVLKREMLDINTGLAERKTKKQIGIYPNPVRDRLNLILPDDRGVKAEICIYDLKGQLVYREIYEDASNPVIEMNTISPGTYLLSVNSGGKVYAEKFIKR